MEEEEKVGEQETGGGEGEIVMLGEVLGGVE